MERVFSFIAPPASPRKPLRDTPQEGCLYRACCRASIIQRISRQISSICCRERKGGFLSKSKQQPRKSPAAKHRAPFPRGESFGGMPEPGIPKEALAGEKVLLTLPPLLVQRDPPAAEGASVGCSFPPPAPNDFQALFQQGGDPQSGSLPFSNQVL